MIVQGPILAVLKVMIVVQGMTAVEVHHLQNVQYVLVHAATSHLLIPAFTSSVLNAFSLGVK